MTDIEASNILKHKKNCMRLSIPLETCGKNCEECGYYHTREEIFEAIDKGCDALGYLDFLTFMGKAHG